MADSKISALTENTTRENALEFVVNNAGTSEKITLSTLAGSTPTGGRGVIETGSYLYPEASSTSTFTDRSPTADTMYGMSLLIESEVTINRIGIHVITARASGEVVRLGIYEDTAGSYRPSNLVLDAGTVSVATTGEKEITISQTLSPGRYWVALAAQNITTTPVLRGQSFTTSLVRAYASTSSTVITRYVSQDGTVTGALPSTFTADTVSTASPALVFLRRV